MGFTLPVVNDNKEGWGPGAPPEKFEGMPYAPFEKRAFIGRMADWSARAEQYRERMRNRPVAVRALSRRPGPPKPLSHTRRIHPAARSRPLALRPPATPCCPHPRRCAAHATREGEVIDHFFPQMID